jgi:hypothetical protein
VRTQQYEAANSYGKKTKQRKELGSRARLPRSPLSQVTDAYYAEERHMVFELTTLSIVRTGKDFSPSGLKWSSHQETLPPRSQCGRTDRVR